MLKFCYNSLVRVIFTLTTINNQIEALSNPLFRIYVYISCYEQICPK